MCLILPLLNMLRNCNMFHFLQLYRSSFKLTVTKLNNNNDMYPLPFFYLNWEIHSRLYNTSSTYNAIPSEIMHECLGAFLVR